MQTDKKTREYSSFEHLVKSIGLDGDRRSPVSMFTVYLDDSGTDNQARIISGAYCVSSVREWQMFERRWKIVAEKAGFKHFHMTEFAGCRPGAWCRDCKNGKKTEKHHPWRSWTQRKRDVVLTALVELVNEFSRSGLGIAITKADYDDLVVNAEMKKLAGDLVGHLHFTYTVQLCVGQIEQWRTVNGVRKPMQYVFDTTDDLKQKAELVSFFVKTVLRKDARLRWGFTPNGYSFQSRKTTLPLLAADMLAWASAKARASQLFGTRKLSPEATFVIKRFVDRKKLTIAHISRNQLQKWAEQETEYLRTQKAG